MLELAAPACWLSHHDDRNCTNSPHCINCQDCKSIQKINVTKMAEHAHGVGICVASGVLPYVDIVGGALGIQPSHDYDQTTGSSDHSTPITCNSGEIVPNLELRTVQWILLWMISLILMTYPTQGGLLWRINGNYLTLHQNHLQRNPKSCDSNNAP